MFNIKVTDLQSNFYGQTLKGSCFYYDIEHTGDSDNLYVAETKDGKRIKLLSSQIDEEYYHKQEFAKEIGYISKDMPSFQDHALKCYESGVYGCSLESALKEYGLIK